MKIPAFTLALGLAVGSTHSALAQEIVYSDFTDDPNGLAVVEFVDLVFNQGRAEDAFAAYIGDVYIQHNPNLASGPEAAFEALSRIPPRQPGEPLRYDIKRVLVDGDLVAVHAHVVFEPDTLGNAVVDIFRVEDGLIVQHWDVIQPVPENPANDNTMF